MTVYSLEQSRIISSTKVKGAVLKPNVHLAFDARLAEVNGRYILNLVFEDNDDSTLLPVELDQVFPASLIHDFATVPLCEIDGLSALEALVDRALADQVTEINFERRRERVEVCIYFGRIETVFGAYIEADKTTELLEFQE